VTATVAQALSRLRNVGKAALRDFDLLGVTTVADLAARDADELYVRLSRLTGRRQDPCVHDVFAAAIHEARTGEARNWWAFTPARKARQARGEFPSA
jgi:nucleotidyltransferase/DNA polymerase involved in DNA repair